MTRLSGRVPETGTAISGVTVAIIDTQGTEDPTQWSIVASTTTDTNGEWSVSGLAPSAVERYHAVAQYDSGAEFVNFESLPYLSTPADAFAPTTSVNVGTPTASVSVGSAIPDSDIYQFDASEETSIDPTWAAEVGPDADAIGNPTLLTGEQNGLNVINYNGNGHDTNELADPTTDSVYYIVVRFNEAPSNFTYFWGGSGGSTSRNYLAIDSGEFFVGFGTDGDGPFGGTVPTNQFILLSLEVVGGSSVTFYVDDNERTTRTFNADEAGLNEYIGGANLGSGLDGSIDHDIGEVRKSSGSTKDDDIVQGLADKWGITL